MKPTLKNLKSLATKYGAEVETNCYDGDLVSIEVLAPDGKQWVEGGCLTMVEVYYRHAPESKPEAFETLMRRIGYGLEELDEILNP
jgi:hypothetical protein